jgi:hypothetical protein
MVTFKPLIAFVKELVNPNIRGRAVTMLALVFNNGGSYEQIAPSKFPPIGETF